MNTGYIYKICSHQTNDIYIGSTKQKLCARMSGHRQEYKLNKNGSKHYYTSFEILKYDDAYIELIEIIKYDIKQELLKKEGEYIRNLECVNKQIAGQTMPEYKKNNIENKKQIDKEYYEKNKETILKRQKIKYNENKELFRQKNKERYNNRKSIKYI